MAERKWLLSEVESWFPEDYLPLGTAEKRDQALEQKPSLPWGFLELQGIDHPPASTQEKKAGAHATTPTGNCGSSPSVGFRGELNRPAFTLAPHAGMRWGGWLSAVTSVKTQPSSGNSLCFVLLLESNYHLVICYREVLFLCVSKHKMQQFGEQVGSFQSLEQKGREIILFLPKESHAHRDSPSFGI